MRVVRTHAAQCPTNPSPYMLRASLVAVRAHPETGHAPRMRGDMPFRSRSKELATSRFELRLTRSERAELEEAADIGGVSVSELVRRRALGRTVHSASDLTTIRELRRLGGLQKHVINKFLTRPEITGECIATIKALREAIERLAR